MIRAAVVALLAASGCAFIAKGQVNKYSRQVAAYEKLAPDAEALGRGDVATTSDAVREMNDWAGYIEQQDLPPVERQQLVDRLAVARRNYMLAAARLANTPDLGYALARSVLTEGDADALAEVRELADARASRRQELFATTHTYEMDLGDDPVWKTTASGMSVVDGQVTGAYEHHELVERGGNCVFATRPFGKEGTANPGLTFRLVGDGPFHVRCYIRKDPTLLPREDRAWVISASAGGYNVKGLTPASSPSRARDFVLTPTSPPADAFAHLQFDLSYEYSDGMVVVWEDGDQRLKKKMLSLELAGSPVFWENAGDGGREVKTAHR